MVRIHDGRGRRRVNFVHASYPVNFDGRMECLPTRVIQATHTLLYAAGYQALGAREPGMKRIMSDTDDEIAAAAMEYL